MEEQISGQFSNYAANFKQMEGQIKSYVSRSDLSDLRAYVDKEFAKMIQYSLFKT